MEVGVKQSERQIRIQAALAAEATEPESYYWMSFCDPSLPKGSQFLGATVVKAQGAATATRRAWDLGINPGGEVAFVEFENDSDGAQRTIDFAFERLRTADELRSAGLVD